MDAWDLVRLAQPITDAGLGENMGRPLSVRLDLLPQRAHIDAQILHVRVVSPNLPQHETMGQDLARMRHHETQNLVFAWRKLDFVVAHRDDPAHEIDAKIAGMEQRLFAFLLEAMALRRADARQKLVDPEGLGHVIIGAPIERFDLGAFLFRIELDDDRESRAAVPYALDDVETIHVRQTEVEDKEIGGASANHVERGARIARGRDEIALAFQARAKKANDRRLIVDDENAQLSCPRRHGSVPGGGAVPDAGRVIVRTAPSRAARFAAVSLPPMASTKPRQIARPSPVPARWRSPRRTR